MNIALQQMKLFKDIVRKANQELYNPVGLNILDPLKVAYLFVRSPSLPFHLHANILQSLDFQTHIFALARLRLSIIDGPDRVAPSFFFVLSFAPCYHLAIVFLQTASHHRSVSYPFLPPFLLCDLPKSFAKALPLVTCSIAVRRKKGGGGSQVDQKTCPFSFFRYFNIHSVIVLEKSPALSCLVSARFDRFESSHP